MGLTVSCESANVTMVEQSPTGNWTEQIDNDNYLPELVSELVLDGLGIFINIIALVALALVPNKNPSILFLTGFAVAELLCPVCYMADVFLNIWMKRTGQSSAFEGAVIFFSSIADSSMIAAFLTLLCISLDRLIASWTVNYVYVVTTVRVRTTIIICWIFAIFVGAIPLLYISLSEDTICNTAIHERTVRWFHIALIMFIFGVMLFAYIRIFYNIRKYRRVLHEAHSVDKQMTRFTTTAFLIVVLYALFWFPVAALQIHLALTSNDVFYKHYKKFALLHSIFNYLNRLNYIIDPIIYVSRNDQIKQALTQRWQNAANNSICRSSPNGRRTAETEVASKC